VCNVSIKLGTIVEEDVLFVAVDRREGTLGEFHAWACVPKEETVVARVIEELQGMF
jgi:hypothetical protein